MADDRALSRPPTEDAPPRINPWPLPPGLVPIGLSRVQASAYVGVSPPLFDAMVGDGRMPKPKRINRRTVWDRRAVEEAFRNLDHAPGDSPRPRAAASAGRGAPPGADAPDWDDVAP